jgi:multisubunit Na+/H+ antiporter MnhC subunit
VLLPLKSMPAILGPVNVLVFTSIVVNFMLTTILQVYAARNLQAVSSKSSGVSSPT